MYALFAAAHAPARARKNVVVEYSDLFLGRVHRRKPPVRAGQDRSNRGRRSVGRGITAEAMSAQGYCFSIAFRMADIDQQALRVGTARNVSANSSNAPQFSSEANPDCQQRRSEQHGPKE
jgi:hypothetical protein